VPKTLLAIDDSATMRRVLEITFVGEDFTVLTAGDRAAFVAKLSENPNAVVIDTTLEGDDGYAICKEVRQRVPRAAIVLMASRYTPYDQGRGKDSGADDYIDKPFDTQQLIDKVKKAIGTREAGAPAQAAAAPPPPPPPVAAPQPAYSPQPVAAAMPRLSNEGAASPPAPAVRPGFQPYQPGTAPQRSGTLMFAADGPALPPAVGAAPSPPKPPVPVAAPPAPKPPITVAAPAPPPPAPMAAAAATAATNGQLAPKLAQLGLTPAQIEGVLALSREVVEQVVWEVVPHLAEALIKEEIARLTKE
jgi:CheY-like chemotaxis protein